MTQLLALGKENKKAPDILTKVQQAASRWKRFAEKAEVTSKSTKEIARKFVT